MLIVKPIGRFGSPRTCQQAISFPSRHRCACPTAVARGENTSMKVSFVWFRRDLRVSDHEPLTAAASGQPDYLLPVYCLDQEDCRARLATHPEYAFPKLGPFRARALLEALQSLRCSLRERQSDLLFRCGSPDAVLPALLPALPEACQEVELFFHMEPLVDDADLEDRVASAFTVAAEQLGKKCRVHRYWGITLFHPDDLPYNKYQPTAKPQSTGRPNRDTSRYAVLPPVMTQWRKVTQAHTPVRPLVPSPGSLPPLPVASAQMQSILDPGDLPSSVNDIYKATGAIRELQTLQVLTGVDYSAVPAPGRGSDISHTAFPMEVTEDAALRRLRTYLWGGNADDPQASGQPHQPPALTYFENTRMQAVGVDNSTKLSPFLAQGVISPRQVYFEIQKLKELAMAKEVALSSGSSNQGAAAPSAADSFDANWLVMHLCIRDFFILMSMKGGREDLRSGQSPVGATVEWKDDPIAFQRWASGSTGLPFVDACMRELAGSGWMSNRGRQNVASLLTKDLLIDWKLGAALFECLLIDHEPAVNLSNWRYFAGVGNDPRNRKFKTVTQGEKYDADAVLVTNWVPELAGLPVRLRHRPWEGEAEAGYSNKGAGGNVDSGCVVCGNRRRYPEPLVDVREQIGVGANHHHKKGGNASAITKAAEPASTANPRQ